jgi:hypothetical protein
MSILIETRRIKNLFLKSLRLQKKRSIVIKTKSIEESVGNLEIVQKN